MCRAFYGRIRNCRRGIRGERGRQSAVDLAVSGTRVTASTYQGRSRPPGSPRRSTAATGTEAQQWWIAPSPSNKPIVTKGIE